VGRVPRVPKEGGTVSIVENRFFSLGFVGGFFPPDEGDGGLCGAGNLEKRVDQLAHGHLSLTTRDGKDAIFELSDTPVCVCV